MEAAAAAAWESCHPSAAAGDDRRADEQSSPPAERTTREVHGDDRHAEGEGDAEGTGLRISEPDDIDE